MKLGLNFVPPHNSPEEWADILFSTGYQAVCFPVDYHAPVAVIDRYVSAARERGITIAEVGIWNSPHTPDSHQAQKARRACEEQFRLADYIRAECCVNVSGAAGPLWYGCYEENYSASLYEANVNFVQALCDRVSPSYTCYALEPMQWMLPDSPEQYLQFLKDVDRPHFGVHMDIVNLIHSPYLYTHQEALMERSFRLLGPYIRSCHLKDCLLQKGVSVSFQEVPLGEGGIQAELYLNHIRELNPDLPVLLEHLPDMEAYDKAFRHAKRLLDSSQ